MKAIKVELLVIDSEGFGAEEVARTLASNKYISAQVLSTQEVDIGEWSDEHPLNKLDSYAAEADRIFNQQPAGQDGDNG